MGDESIIEDARVAKAVEGDVAAMGELFAESVSYTHLTLPTTPYV